MRYYPKDTFYYEAKSDTFFQNQYFHAGDFLLTNKPAPEPFVLHSPASDGLPDQHAKVVITDVTWTEEDGFLAAAHDAREVLKGEQAKSEKAKEEAEAISKAHKAVKKAELDLQQFHEAKRTTP